MAVSALIVTTPMPLAQTQSLNPPPTTSLSSFKPTSTCSCSCSSSSSSSFSATQQVLNGCGMRLLASSIMALSPLEADATRIEYYATVGEPLCELNFVLSGLGFYDVSVGSGVEAPRGELINIHYTARFADGTVLVLARYENSYDGVPPMQIGKTKKLLMFLYEESTSLTFLHIYHMGQDLQDASQVSFCYFLNSIS
ncbi:peptidyl-prolyl cis-trans isomerase FKBP16-2 [Pyrus ussuriensis x Pyrus communis]|uniref:Peptidyl-prolyl cis-trans isomerase FKBP16-2 n=1 Tax=Pyrus ussuriensis x Pyrus communis TaxID=2448454 RepID=A0A5N5F3K9_9ROSA|nr:peptidyl-prolyl cis-trans isomerase FKBP16-2 [Pyrus ussuriensis x Pyrus communis]